VKPTQWDPALYEQSHSYVWREAAGLIEWLAPQAGERILDLGCGTGRLTARIAEAGAKAIGLDRSPEMVSQARANYPDIEFQTGDATDFAFAEPFDAVFSNAALHWVPQAGDVARCVARVLKPGGRFVAEFGGKGNVRWLVAAATAALERRGYPVRIPWYFPGVAEYSALLEQHGFEIRLASLFPRPTGLDDPKDGLRNWYRMFGQSLLDAAPDEEHEEIFCEIEDFLRPRLYRDGKWFADYRRLRVKAVLEEH